MGTKVAWSGWSRFPLMGIQELCAWETGVRHRAALTLGLGQWLRAWVSQHSRRENKGSGQLANHSTKQQRWTQIRSACFWQHTMVVILTLSLLVNHSIAAFIEFENCLTPSIINNPPLQLQLVPLHVYAKFNTTATSHNLNITVYGNVSGSATPTVPLEPWDDTQYWANSSATTGKILDVSPTSNVASTLFASFNVLSYTPYSLGATRFANTTLQGQFPLAPVFTPNV